MAKTPNTPEWRAFREAADRHIQNEWDRVEPLVSAKLGLTFIKRILKNGKEDS